MSSNPARGRIYMSAFVCVYCLVLVEALRTGVPPVQVKEESRNRPGVAQGVPGGLGSQIS